MIIAESRTKDERGLEYKCKGSKKNNNDCASKEKEMDNESVESSASQMKSDEK